MGTPKSYSLLEMDNFPYKGVDLLGGLEDNAKKLWEACQEPDLSNLSSILDHLDQDILEKIMKKDVKDKNQMNIFHVLFFDKQNKKWYTKKMKTETRKKVVTFIEAICQEVPEENIVEMMKSQDNYQRTPLHYAGIIDGEKAIAGEKENDASNITLALLKCGADKALFVKDKNEGIPVCFIGTSILKAYLDTKQEIDGPIGHKDTMVNCYVSALQPESSQKKSLNFEFLEILAKKHRDLFDHQVISAMIWERRKAYLMDIGIAFFMKLVAFVLLFLAFPERFGIIKQSEALTFSLIVEFSPWLIDLWILSRKGDFFRTRGGLFLSFFHLAIGISLIIASEVEVNLPDQKGLAGIYIICSTYSLFRSFRDFVQPTLFEMFGWFEVVFWNIVKLLAVHSWLLFAFAYAFYIQFSNFGGNTNQDQDCRRKLKNCTEIITTLNNTELKPEILDDCIHFFQECTDANQFNDWKVMLKTLSMSAGELTFDDLPFLDNPLYVLTYALFIIVVLFVIMNLMTSLAVNDISAIKNQSRDRTWYKLMLTLKWYNASLFDCWGRKCWNKEKISFLLHEQATLKNPFSYFTRTPINVDLGVANISSIFPLFGNCGTFSAHLELDGLRSRENAILVGDTRRFQHFRLPSIMTTFEFPSKMGNKKIALVEEEDETSYKTTQYLIKKDWTLVISKSDPDLQPTHTYRVQQKMSNGELRDLVGKPKVYLDKNSKFPKNNF